MSAPVLYYWPIRARNYAAQVVAQAGGISVELQVPDLANADFKASLPFGQVPYLVHGDIKIAQSGAVLRYLAKLGSLQGDSEADFARSEMLIEEAADLFNLIVKANYSPDKAVAYTELFSADGSFAKQLAFLERILQVDGKKFAGDYAIAALLDMAVALEPTILDAFPIVKAFTASLLATPAFNGVKDLPMYFQRA